MEGRNDARNGGGNSLAHLLQQFVVLEALVDRHLALGFALLLYNLLYVVSILGRVSLFASLRLSVMGLPMTRTFSALLLLRLLLLLLHLRLSVGALVGSIVLLPSGVMVLSMADEI